MPPNIRVTTKEAYQLFHEGSIALAEAEYNGILCDKSYCRRTIDNLERQIKTITQKMDDTELGKTWREKYKRETNYDSGPQLRKILYEDLGLESKKKTKGGKKGKKVESIDAESLEALGREDLKLYLQRSSLLKMKNTYLGNILQESLPDGWVHPFFHLSDYDEERSGGARSYRGSSSDPNFQNQPNRHENERRMVRRAFISRPGHRIVGRDYGGMEVKISACNHQDPNMIRYIEHGDDMHRDCASLCFKLPKDLCTSKYGPNGKNIRFVGKNSFVFAQFYFQDPSNSARNLWGAIKDLDLRHPKDEDKTIYQHLADKGIGNYDAFEKHIQKVAKEFWEGMFPGYWKWRLKWIEDYNKRGYFDMLTGFRVEGVMSQFQLANYPIQGPAFHCLLWAMIQVHRLWKKEGRKSLIIGQIHDELTTDELAEEFPRNQEIIPRIMAEDIRKEWPWIIVPLEVETDATPVGGSWYEKKGVD
jgi:DNA polymerase-1